MTDYSKPTTWEETSSSTAGSYEAERREDLSLKDTELCNILIKKQAFMNSPMTHAESR